MNRSRRHSVWGPVGRYGASRTPLRRDFSGLPPPRPSTLDVVRPQPVAPAVPHGSLASAGQVRGFGRRWRP
eukprot:6114648-Lingulodinium_polyedra.AAC.1